MRFTSSEKQSEDRLSSDEFERLCIMCVGLYRYREGEIEDWMKKVVRILRVFQFKSGTPIHSIRSRLKEESHLRDKISRKQPWPNQRLRKLIREATQIPTLDHIQQHGLPHEWKDLEDAFWKKFRDLAGVRIISLYKEDQPIIDFAVRDASGTRWEVTEVEVNCDEQRADLKEWYRDNLLTDQDDPDKTLKPQAQGYYSVHYSLTRLPDQHGQPFEACELQVRTIHEEAWGEFSHELRYPHGVVDPLAEKLIISIGRLLHISADLVSDVRRQPLNSLITRYIAPEIGPASSDGRDDWARWDKVVEDVSGDLIKQAPYLVKSGPFASVRLLGRKRGPDTGGPTKQITSLDFSPRASWAYDNSHVVMSSGVPKLYLHAHDYWLRRGDDRLSNKFFVWSEDQRVAASTGVDLIDEYDEYGGEKSRFFEVSRKLFNYLHNAIQRHSPGSEQWPNPAIRRTQFFVWDMPHPEPPLNFDLPRDDSINSISRRGFYCPMVNADLSSHVIWIRSTTDPVLPLLASYVQVLNALVDREVIQRVSKKTSKAPAPLFTEHVVDEIVHSVFAQEGEA